MIRLLHGQTGYVYMGMKIMKNQRRLDEVNVVHLS